MSDRRTYPTAPHWYVTRGMTQYGWEVYEADAGAMGVRLYTHTESAAIELAAHLNNLLARSREAMLRKLEREIAEEFEPEANDDMGVRAPHEETPK